MVLAARRNFTAGSASSRNSVTLFLCGIVTFNPRMPNARTPRIAFSSSSDVTLKARKTKSSFKCSKAALCMVGLSVCSIGSPITAQTRVFPEIAILFEPQHFVSGPHFFNSHLPGCRLASTLKRGEGEEAAEQRRKKPRNSAILTHSKTHHVSSFAGCRRETQQCQIVLNPFGGRHDFAYVCPAGDFTFKHAAQFRNVQGAFEIVKGNDRLSTMLACFGGELFQARSGQLNIYVVKATLGGGEEDLFLFRFSSRKFSSKTR